jgi:hypothetical protein
MLEYLCKSANTPDRVPETGVTIGDKDSRWNPITLMRTAVYNAPGGAYLPSSL